jgi:hypothetical protein
VIIRASLGLLSRQLGHGEQPIAERTRRSSAIAMHDALSPEFIRAEKADGSDSVPLEKEGSGTDRLSSGVVFDARYTSVQSHWSCGPDQSRLRRNGLQLSGLYL